MKRLFACLALAVFLVTAPESRAQAPPPPELSSPERCPAIIRLAYDLSAFPTADRVRWRLRRAGPGEDFAAAVGVDSGESAGATGSVRVDLRNRGPVLDGTRYFVQVRAQQGSTVLSPFSEPAVFEASETADGMFAVSPGLLTGIPSAESRRTTIDVAYSLTGAVAA